MQRRTPRSSRASEISTVLQKSIRLQCCGRAARYLLRRPPECASRSPNRKKNKQNSSHAGIHAQNAFTRRNSLHTYRNRFHDDNALCSKHSAVTVGDGTLSSSSMLQSHCRTLHIAYTMRYAYFNIGRQSDGLFRSSYTASGRNSSSMVDMQTNR